MSIFSKKQLTPDDKFEIARKKKSKALKKRNKLDKKYKYKPFKDFDQDYKDKRQNLNQQIAEAISDENFAKDLAKEEAKHPKPVPQYVDTSKCTVFAPQTEVNVGSKNEAKAEGRLVFEKGAKEKEAAPTTNNKNKSKFIVIFFFVVAVLIIAGTAALSSYITSCIYKKNDNSSCIYLLHTT